MFTLFIASLGGFLFGYQLAVIAGALLFFSAEFGLTSLQQGMVVSILLLGALLGSLCAGKMADFLGRKKTLIVTALIFCMGSLFSMVAPSFITLLIARTLTGFAVGLVSIGAPLYLAEIAPPSLRGRFVSMNQLALTIGILVAYLVNSYFGEAGEWREMFGVAFIPAFIQLVGLFFIKEPERVHELSQERRFSSLFHKEYRFLVLIGILLSLFQQLSGINTVIYYAPMIFEMAGTHTKEGAVIATISIGVVNVIATLCATLLLDRLGRRFFLLLGSAGMTLALSILALSLVFPSMISPQIPLLAYIVLFAVSLGPIPWVLISEIYPVKIRGHAMGLSLAVNWAANFFLAFIFLDLVAHVTLSGTFLIYALVAIVAFWFTYRYIPETRGKTFEEIQQLFNS